MKIIKTIPADFPSLGYPARMRQEDSAYFDYKVEKTDLLNIYQGSNIFIDNEGYVFNALKIFPVSFFLRDKIEAYTAIKHIYKSRLTKEKKVIAEGVWVYDIWINGYFHWFSDALHRYFQITETINKKPPLVLPERLKKYPYILDSLQLLEIPAIWIGTFELVVVKQLYLIDYLPCPGTFTLSAMNTLRDKVVTACRTKPQQEKRIYISRAKAKIRKVLNEEQILPLLHSFGFQVCFLEDLDWTDQVVLLSNASILIGLHGAGLTNMLWMPKQSKVIEIRMESSYEQWCYYELAATCNHDYSYLLCKPGEEHAAPHNGNVWIDVAKLESQLHEVIEVLP